MCKVLPRLCVHGNDEMSSERLSEKGTKKMKLLFQRITRSRESIQNFEDFPIQFLNLR